MKSILIAEDHPLVYFGMENFLIGYLGDVKVCVAEDFMKTLDMLEKQKFDLLILDINIPYGDKVGMVYSVRTKQPDIPILICSSYDEQLYALPFLKAGANGYLSKTATRDEFKVAVTNVMNNKTYASPGLLQTAFSRLINTKNQDSPASSHLSEKEMEVASLLVKGLSTKSIGERINLSSSSVSSYKTRILEKLGITNIIELTTYFELNP